MEVEGEANEDAKLEVTPCEYRPKLWNSYDIGQKVRKGAKHSQKPTTDSGVT